MGKQESALVWKPIAKPKYSEEISGEEAAVFYPWEIMLMIRPSGIDDFTYPQYMYVRGADRQQVAVVAHNLWIEWYKTSQGLTYHRYPDVEEMGTGRGIEEQEYQEMLMWAKQHPSYRYLGMRDNPSAFTFIDDKVKNPKSPIRIIPK